MNASWGPCVSRRAAVLPRGNAHQHIAHPFRLVLLAGPLLLALVLAIPVLAATPLSDVKPGPNESGNQDVLREVNRLLEEEIKLASRPQVYVLLDLHENVLLIKGRGMELHRLGVEAWCVSGDKAVAGLFRLRARPAVTRPKAVPSHDPALEPINLYDMPAEYLLTYDPGLLVAVSPSMREQPWLWARSLLRAGWARFRAWSRLAVGNDPVSDGPVLHLTLSSEAARSLAWSVTDDMPLLVGRTTLP